MCSQNLYFVVCHFAVPPLSGEAETLNNSTAWPGFSDQDSERSTELLRRMQLQ